jgi:hypothetical protein
VISPPGGTIAGITEPAERVGWPSHRSDRCAVAAGARGFVAEEMSARSCRKVDCPAAGLGDPAVRNRPAIVPYTSGKGIPNNESEDLGKKVETFGQVL